ncbi:secretory carrier-associated membrane protein 2-like, partial [Scleropages formosus]
PRPWIQFFLKHTEFLSSFQSIQNSTTIPISAAQSQPAVLQASVSPSPQFTSRATRSDGVLRLIALLLLQASAHADLLRQQEELERKAAELDRKEQELQNRGATTDKENNWPPLPRCFPIKPCFYQDFAVEIPPEFQRVCKMMYYLWMFHCVTLILNMLACLAAFTVNSAKGVDFGLSILWFILFTPCSFLCWYRPVYKAFRSDSSFSFFFFFFVFFFQVVVYIIQSVGIPSWGNSGWITSISMIRSNLGVAVVMMVVAGFFTMCAVLAIILLKMV